MASLANAIDSCAVCHSTDSLKRCRRCSVTQYCSTACQRSDWRSHKPQCQAERPAPSRQWYNSYRKCADGAKHEGRLELVTWSVKDHEGEDMGWGNVVAEESDDLKRKFEVEFRGDEAKLYAHWPQAFRWTCCGTDGDQHFGCGHHGMGSTPCTCDFCKVSQEARNIHIFPQD